MNSLFFGLMWCGVQVALISFLAYVASRFLIQDAARSSRLLNVTAVLVLGLTLAAFVRLDDAIGRSFTRTDSPNTVTESKSSASTLRSLDDDSGLAQTTALSVSGRQLRNWLTSVRSKGTQAAATVGCHAPSRWCVYVGLTFSCIAIVRLGGSCVYLRRLLRGSSHIDDDSIKAEVAALCCRVGLNGPVNVAESDHVDNAAVFGIGRRSRIVLPMSWRTWSPAERSAVLAHEISHLVRNDAVWRTIQAFAFSLHAYNPIMRLLQQRGVLMQEVAADRYASQTLKTGNLNYLQGLLQLAIRQDDTFPTSKSLGTGILVQSDFLLRRIEMLRTKDGIQTHVVRSAIDGSIAFGLTATLALVAVASYGLRGVAQETATPEIRVASRSTSASALPDAKLFQRPVFDPAAFGENDDGMFIIRFDELSRIEGMKPLLSLAGVQLTAMWKKERPDWPIPDINLNDLEYVGGHATMTLDAPNPKDERPNRLMYGADVIAFRFKSPIDLVASIKKFAPDAEVVRRGDTNVFKIRPIACIGPQPFYLQLKDPQTVLLIKAIEDKTASKSKENENWQRPWRSTWEREDGGCATFVASNVNFKRTIVRNEEGQLIEDVIRNIETFSVAIDSVFPKGAYIRVVLGCETSEKAAIVSQRYNSGIAKLKKEPGPIVMDGKTKGEQHNPDAKPQEDASGTERLFFEKYLETPSCVEVRSDGGADVIIEYPVEDLAAGLLKAF